MTALYKWLGYRNDRAIQMTGLQKWPRYTNDRAIEMTALYKWPLYCFVFVGFYFNFILIIIF